MNLCGAVHINNKAKDVKKKKRIRKRHSNKGRINVEFDNKRCE